ncbi:MAG: hypothetical protein IPP73_17405 [Chitinophagaceae bacterium]|nr:hypothetical protein [Chitinophagaceae bacterium]
MNHFRYGSFIKDGSDFSGNKTPSVPAFTASLQLNIDYQKGSIQIPAITMPPNIPE